MTQTDHTTNSGTQTCEEFDNLEDIVNNIKNQLQASCSMLEYVSSTEDISVMHIDESDKECRKYNSHISSDDVEKSDININERDKRHENKSKDPRNGSSNTLIQNALRLSPYTSTSVDNNGFCGNLEVLSDGSPLTSDDSPTSSFTLYQFYDLDFESINMLQKHFQFCSNVTYKNCFVNNKTAGVKFQLPHCTHTRQYLNRVIFSIICQTHQRSSALPETLFSTIGYMSPTASLLLALGNFQISNGL